MDSELEKKIICYNGVINFGIPKNWIEEYDDDGAAFYEDTPNSGTFRLKLISIEIPESDIRITASDVLFDLTNNKESKPVVLPNKNAYNMFYNQSIDNGLDISIYYWSLVQAIEFNKTRLANFSYTILTKELNKDSVNQEIDFITKQVETAVFQPL